MLNSTLPYCVIYLDHLSYYCKALCGFFMLRAGKSALTNVKDAGYFTPKREKNEAQHTEKR